MQDYLPAVSMGMHAVLLDRFNTKEALEWRKASIPVFNDLGAWTTDRTRFSIHLLGAERI